MTSKMSARAFMHRYPIVGCSFIVATFCGVFSMLFKKTFQSVFSSMFGLVIDQRRAARLTQEIARKSFHLLGLAIIPFIDHFSRYTHTISLILLALGGLCFLLDEVRLHSAVINDLCKKTPFMRPSEYDSLTGVPTFLLGVSAALFFNSKIAIYALLFGDTAAAFVGIAVGRTRIQERKTLEGFFAFVAAVSCCCGECGVPLRHGIMLGIAGGCCELYCDVLHINDNLLIPLGVSVLYFCFEAAGVY